VSQHGAEIDFKRCRQKLQKSDEARLRITASSPQQLLEPTLPAVLAALQTSAKR